MNKRKVSYCGYRTETGARVVKMENPEAGDETIPLNPRLDLRNHSPTGFAWGYMGSGPSQLSLAILADYLGDDARALRLYQEFKEKFIAPLDVDVWVIGSERLDEIISSIDSKNGN